MQKSTFKMKSSVQIRWSQGSMNWGSLIAWPGSNFQPMGQNQRPNLHTTQNLKCSTQIPAFVCCWCRSVLNDREAAGGTHHHGTAVKRRVEISGNGCLCSDEAARHRQTFKTPQTLFLGIKIWRPGLWPSISLTESLNTDRVLTIWHLHHS